MIGDVSDSGIFLVTPSPTIPCGQRVVARIDEQSLSLNGVIVHVAQGSQLNGYGIKLDDPPFDTVDRLVAPSAPPPRLTTSPAPPVQPVAVPSTPVAAVAAMPGPPRVLIVMADEEVGAAMALSLNAFHTSTVYHRPDHSLLGTLANLAQVDVALVDSATIAARGPLTIASLKTHVRARAIILYGDTLPTVDVRRQLQLGGVDQLWVAPLRPFEAMNQLQSKVRKR